MKKLYKEMHEYLNMEEEIPFEQFDDFYKRIIAFFNDHADELKEEEIWQALFISENVMSNADGRAKMEKGSAAKKYVKMHKRLSLWAQNYAARLARLGYNKDQMNERFESMFEEEIN